MLECPSFSSRRLLAHSERFTTHSVNSCREPLNKSRSAQIGEADLRHTAVRCSVRPIDALTYESFTPLGTRFTPSMYTTKFPFARSRCSATDMLLVTPAGDRSARGVEEGRLTELSCEAYAFRKRFIFLRKRLLRRARRRTTRNGRPAAPGHCSSTC